MIKLKDLEKMGDITFGNAEGVNLDAIRAAITSLARQNDVPVAFYMDEAKDGGIFGNTYSSLVAYHPEHQRDYFNLAMILTKTGTYANLSIYAAGKSKQMNKFARSETNKKLRHGRSMSFQIGNAVASGLMNLGKSKQKLAEEQMYYELVLDIIGAAFNE